MPPKRKAPAEADDAAAPRRSTRARTSTSRASPSPPATAVPKPKKVSKAAAALKPEEDSKAAAVVKSKKDSKAAPVKSESKGSDSNGAAAPAAPAATHVDDGDENATERQYWLLKAEPETRLEKGVDVSFSIDDLAAKTVPEPWDGIRNYVARNNLRAMKKGDLGFFWHSNCKEPGLVGTMEIVQEHSPDFSADDPKSAYYDPKSTTATGEPKWSVVHVEFRRKFAVPVTLKELRGYAEGGGPLAEMQMLKQSRLSVSRVSEAEWEFLMGLLEGKEKEKK